MSGLTTTTTCDVFVKGLWELCFNPAGGSVLHLKPTCLSILFL